MTEQRISTTRVPQLELLRVLATAGIFVFHLWSVVPLRSVSPPLDSLLSRVPVLGALGVIIFNIVTGFVLAAPYLGTTRPLPRFGDFVWQRFARICLHYYPTLLLWTLVDLLVVQDSSAPTTLVAFLSHLFFVHTFSASTFFTIVPAFWWLGLVAQFYVLCPWLLRLYGSLGAGRACLLACGLPWLLWGGLTSLAEAAPGSSLALIHYLAYFNLPVRLPEFALGMALACAWNRGLRFVRGSSLAPSRTSRSVRIFVSLLLASGFYVALQTHWLVHVPRPLDHLYLVGWSVLGVLAILRWHEAVQWGNSHAIVDLAGASYGIYLLHQPLLGYANALLPVTFGASHRFLVLLFGVGILCYLASVSLTIVLYRLVRL